MALPLLVIVVRCIIIVVVTAGGKTPLCVQDRADLASEKEGEGLVQGRPGFTIVITCSSQDGEIIT